MSNLTDLLPAGAGGKQVSFVASGTIGNGVTVGLNSDGTVTAVSAETQSLGSPTIFSSSVNGADPVIAFDVSNNKMVIVYRDDSNLDYGTAVVGTVSGTSISFGSPSVFESGFVNDLSVCYDENAEKIVIAYRNSSLGKSVVATVSGTSISYGSVVTFSATNARYMTVCYDTSNQKVVISYRNGSTNYGESVVGTVSGTSISYGTNVVFNSAQTAYPSSAYDIANSSVVISFDSGSNGSSIVGTVSGTSISFGTRTAFVGSRPSQYIGTAYDANAQKIVVTYSDVNNDETGMAIVGTVSGSSITFGSAVTYSGGQAFGNIVYDTGAKKVVISYRDDNPFYGKLVVGTVSGTSITFGSIVTFESAQIEENPYAAYDSIQKKVVIAYEDVGNSAAGTCVVFRNAQNNSADFIGITAEAISDTASGSVTIKGGISTNVTGLTANQNYYVQTNGTLSTTVSSVLAGKALSSTSINLDYTT